MISPTNSTTGKYLIPKAMRYSGSNATNNSSNANGKQPAILIKFKTNLYTPPIIPFTNLNIFCPPVFYDICKL